MNYKLYKETNPQYSALQQILYNRGIPIKKQEEWLNANENDIYSWRELDDSLKMQRAVQIVQDTILKNNDILVVVDADCDGYTSAAIILNYIYKHYPDYYKNHMSYIHHAGKEHGLNDVLNTILEQKPALVIAPDGGTNDLTAHNILDENDIKVLILDHHDVEADKNIESSPALIINVQLSNYKNKALTGAGVAYKFCCAYSEINHFDEPTWLMDLCALGNCGDMSDYTQLETRAIINVGFNNINNKFIDAMVQKNGYILEKRNGINYNSCAFAIIPFINSITRSGTQEEKTIIFEAMLDANRNQKVPSSKRGAKHTLVPLHDEAVLVAERVKRRQTKLQDEAMAFLEHKIEDENLLDDAMLLLLCNPGEVEKNLAGLVANKLQAKYQRPTAVLTRNKSKDDTEYFYRGSMRNYSMSENQNLKDTLLATGHIEFCSGHQSAAGLGIAESELDDFIAAMNKAYENINLEATYWVDYIWYKNTIDADKILDIGRMNIFGQNMPESTVCICDIPLDSSKVTLMSKDKNPTLKISVNGVDMIKFKSSQEEFDEWTSGDKVLTVIGKCKVNEWNGKVSPQIIVDDYELTEEWIF
jgi:single-stranded-DNA-specific exonuclease